MKTWIVNTAKGETVEVEAARVTEDEGGYLARFYDEDDELVASFRSYSGLFPKQSAQGQQPLAEEPEGTGGS